MSIVYAANEIQNLALPSSVTSKGLGGGLAFYIATLWRTVIIVGGLAFIIYLLWGGIEYMTSGGDKGRVDDAQKKITSSVIGLGLLVASYAIVLFIQAAFKVKILEPVFPSAL